MKLMVASVYSKRFPCHSHLSSFTATQLLGTWTLDPKGQEMTRPLGGRHLLFLAACSGLTGQIPCLGVPLDGPYLGFRVIT